MELHAERPSAGDPGTTPAVERRGREPEPTPDDYIHAAQFMLGTRQREEAVLRAAHLHDDASSAHEDRARETLAEMIHLQEVITARTDEMSRQRGRGKSQRVIDLDTKTSTPTRSSRAPFIWGLVIALLVLGALLAALQLGAV